MDRKKCCGTCKWHSSDGMSWVCVNNNSEYVADFIGYEDVCEEWEGRD